jgi:glucokinase
MNENGKEREVLVVDGGATKLAVALVVVFKDGDSQVVKKTTVLLEDALAAGARSFAEIMERCVAPALDLSMDVTKAFAIGAAGKIEADMVVLDKYPFPMDIGEARDRFGWTCVTILNDTEAQECYSQLPAESKLVRPVVHVPKDDLDMNGGTLFMAVGTGLGVAARTAEGAQIRSEAGNISLSGSVDPKLRRVHARMCRKVSSETLRLETVVSGGGEALLHNCMRPWWRFRQAHAREMPELLRMHSDTASAWSWYLGHAVRDLAVTFWATQGVYLLGGVLDRNPELLNSGNGSWFREGMLFMSKWREEVSRIPVFHVVDPDAAFKALAWASLHHQKRRIYGSEQSLGIRAR